jgi:hypothetical protein
MKKGIVLSLASIVAILSMSLDIHESKGISGLTGSPDEDNCSSNCHVDYPLNSGGGSVLISSPTLEAKNWKYVPGQTYKIDITITKTGAKNFGFGFEALNSNNEDAGSIIVTDSLKTQLQKAFNDRTNIMHKNKVGIAANTFTYTFNWQAPTTDIGTVTFYAASNASNNDGTLQGDYIYTTTKEITSLTLNTSEKFSAIINAYLYPNPTVDYIYLVTPAQLPDKLNMYIYNLGGKLVLKKENITANTAINIVQLPKGNYIAKFESLNGIGVITKKFIKK